MENYRIMLSLGFWKKLVYILNGRLSMSVCLKFADLTNFRVLKNQFNNETNGPVLESDHKELFDGWDTLLKFKNIKRIIFAGMKKVQLLDDEVENNAARFAEIRDEIKLEDIVQYDDPDTKTFNDYVTLI